MAQKAKTLHMKTTVAIRSEAMPMIAAIMAKTQLPTYAAAEAALIAITEGLTLEEAALRMRITLATPLHTTT